MCCAASGNRMHNRLRALVLGLAAPLGLIACQPAGIEVTEGAPAVGEWRNFGDVTVAVLNVEDRLGREPSLELEIRNPSLTGIEVRATCDFFARNGARVLAMPVPDGSSTVILGPLQRQTVRMSLSFNDPGAMIADVPPVRLWLGRVECMASSI